MRLHFLLMHLLDKLFGACCSIQGLFLSYIMVVTASLAGWAQLCLGREGREGKEMGEKRSTLKTKAFKPGHVCEHVCDTFMGWSVRSRDVKSVPPVMLSKSKGGMEEGIPQLWLRLQILPKCCWHASSPSKQWS